MGWDNVAGTALGAGIALGGVWLEQRYAVSREERAFKRSLRMARAERLRGQYVTLAGAVMAFADVAQQMMILWKGDTVEGRDARLNDLLEKKLGSVAAAIECLELEMDTEEVLGLFREANGLFAQYQHMVQSIEADQQAFKTQEVYGGLEQLRAQMRSVIEGARRHLVRLEQ